MLGGHFRNDRRLGGQILQQRHVKTAMRREEVDDVAIVGSRDPIGVQSVVENRAGRGVDSPISGQQLFQLSALQTGPGQVERLQFQSFAAIEVGF